MENIAADIIKKAKINPHLIAISTTKFNLSYSQLGYLILSYMSHMKDNGIDENSCVAIRINSPVISIISILSIALIGSTWGRDILQNKKIKVSHIHTNTKRLSGNNKNIPVIHIDGTWNKVSSERIKRIISKGFAYTERFDKKIWMIAHSSGTTGIKKFMEISYANYWLRNNKAQLTHDFTPVVTANLFPILSAPWVSYNLRTLFLKGTLIFDTDFLFLKTRNVQKIFGSPIQFLSFLKSQKNKINQRIPIAHIAGSSINQGLAEEIFKYFEKIHNFYGATEAGGISRKVLTSLPDNINSVGFLLPGNELKITDENEKELSSNMEGTIQIKNNIVLSSYLDNDEASRSAFKNGWFIPGDIGYINSNGEIFILGRQGDILNINGVKIKAGMIEEKISLCSDVEESLVFMLDENNIKKLSGLIQVKLNADLNECTQQIKKILHENFDRSRRLKNFYFVEKIPINENGKKVRIFDRKLLNNLIKIDV